MLLCTLTIINSNLYKVLNLILVILKYYKHCYILLVERGVVNHFTFPGINIRHLHRIRMVVNSTSFTVKISRL